MPADGNLLRTGILCRCTPPRVRSTSPSQAQILHHRDSASRGHNRPFPVRLTVPRVLRSPRYVSRDIYVQAFLQSMSLSINGEDEAASVRLTPPTPLSSGPTRSKRKYGRSTVVGLRTSIRNYLRGEGAERVVPRNKS